MPNGFAMVASWHPRLADDAIELLLPDFQRRQQRFNRCNVGKRIRHVS